MQVARSTPRAASSAPRRHLTAAGDYRLDQMRLAEITPTGGVERRRERVGPSRSGGNRQRENSLQADFHAKQPSKQPF
jgi:hypothetical protein